MNQTQQSFVAVLDGLASAAGRDAAIRVATRSASDLAGIDGLCLLARSATNSIVALAAGPEIYALDAREENLHQLIAAATGQQHAVGAVVVIPLSVSSGYRSVGFFWQPGRTAEQRYTGELELVANALGLAAGAWLQAEQHERQLRDERRMFTELQHRLRNNLALMRSVVRRSIETANADAEEFALHLEGRLGALSRTQAAMTAAGSDGLELEELVRAELIAGAVPEQRCIVRGPAVWLQPRGAESLGLAIHELATNCLKFGALAAPSGRLEIAWDVTGSALQCLHLSWIESGVTIASVAPRRRGFGQELIECTLPYELGARTRLAFNPGGLECEMEIPLEECASLLEPRPRQALATGGP